MNYGPYSLQYSSFLVFIGKLYWYDLFNVTDCNLLFPIFLMYTNGVLNGFGWVLPHKFDSPLFVHPTNMSYPVCC